MSIETNLLGHKTTHMNVIWPLQGTYAFETYLGPEYRNGIQNGAKTLKSIWDSGYGPDGIFKQVNSCTSSGSTVNTTLP